MSIAITFVGGPADGQLLAVPDDRPPPLYLIPIAPTITELFSNPGELLMPRVAEYEPILEHGRPSFNGEGHYRYRYRGTPEPHVPQSQPTPTVDDLAVMVRDPARAAYLNNPAHLLACRTRYSLRRDCRLNPEEQAAIDAATWAHVRGELGKRRRPA